MKVVNSLSDSRNGTLWKQFHVSVTVFHVLHGMRRARWKGDSELWVSLLQCLFSGERSTVLRGEPSCFLVMTMQWHHPTGSPTGTRSITSRASSCRRSACTWSCQCSGIGAECCFVTCYWFGSLLKMYSNGFSQTFQADFDGDMYWRLNFRNDGEAILSSYCCFQESKKMEAMMVDQAPSSFEDSRIWHQYLLKHHIYPLSTYHCLAHCSNLVVLFWWRWRGSVRTNSRKVRVNDT